MGKDRGNPNNVRRDLRMATIPSSVYSTSQGSGRPLVPGPATTLSRDRSTLGRPVPPSHFSVDQQSNSKSSSRKTKLIIALGLTLPVLACIIGIVAWAMTTDIVRISPHPPRSTFPAVGSKDKNRRRDSLQPRSDQDFDLLMLSKEGVPPVVPRQTTTTTTTGKTTYVSTSTRDTAVPSNASKTSPSTATEIISKLISTSVNQNGPAQFVVFAPVPDDSITTESFKKKNVKIHIDDDTDLIAEESSNSEETSRDIPQIENIQLKNRHHLDRFAEPSRFNEIRDSRAGPPNSGEPFPRRSLDNPQHSLGDTRHPDFDSAPPLHHLMGSGNIHPPDMQFNDPNPPKAFHPHINHPENDDFPSRRLPPRHMDGPPQPQYPPQPNQNNYPPPVLQNQQQYPPQPIPNHDTGEFGPNRNLGGPYNKNMGPNEEHFPRIYPHSPIHDPSLGKPNINNNFGDPYMHEGAFPRPQNAPMGSPFADPGGHDPSLGNPNINNKFGDPYMNEGAFPRPQNAPMGSPFAEPGGQQPPAPAYASNNAPQYYAPPPQTFHTSTSYGSGNSPSSKRGPSETTYEHIGTSIVNQGQTGSSQHHHHHHHHHHEPNGEGSDTHVVSPSSANDADRFGTLGLGLGTPRGITVQVGGLGGLLPIGALGLVRGLASSLLPRPQLGLNRKIFFGVEVGKGGGLSIG